MTAPTIRAFFADASAFPTAKAAAAYVGPDPSTWSSGTVVQPSSNHEGRSSGAAVGVLSGRWRGPPGRSPARGVLPPPHGRAWTLPHPGHGRRRPQARRADLDRLSPGQPFGIPRPRRRPLTRAAAKERARALAVPKTVRARGERAARGHAPLQADQVVQGTPRPGHQGSGGPVSRHATNDLRRQAVGESLRR